METRRSSSAFTLIEMLAVIAIMALIAALVAPTVTNLRKGDATVAATREMLDAVARARQLAISQRTTVYMVFVPTNFWLDRAFASNPNLTVEDRIMATNLAGKQFIGYNYVSLRSIGDQPGQGIPRYLSSWKALPDGSFIAAKKFIDRPLYYDIFGANQNFRIYGFETTTNVPFPLAATSAYFGANGGPWPKLPFIAFDYLGRVVNELSASGSGEYIPLAQGAVLPVYDKDRVPVLGPAEPLIRESPPANSESIYNLIFVDRLTGRARLEHREVQ